MLMIQDFMYNSTLYETFTERDECADGDTCTPEDLVDEMSDSKMTWEEEDDVGRGR